ncbi:TPA: hypothetical protein N0F65_000022 [Lagenidium giganteum]|uniref:Tc1-like transposase DDE domain-containing protein n=1 Tax=Lagenidium giganteum TaxID=4803 RepID=A0AAV2YN47_9STRA|nr:TPA: hypothetical protein N0F65_000022 [Lagenidium giganteum]
MLSDQYKQRRILYMDERYVHHNYSRHQDFLYNPTDPVTVKAKHKGRRYCFIAAIAAHDPSVPESDGKELRLAHLMRNTIDIFEGGKKQKQAKDYHSMFNQEYFVSWMQNLMAVLRLRNWKNCVIVMDNARYHKVKCKSFPSKGARKEVLLQACTRFGIPASNAELKAEIWEKLSKYMD